jgi:hypothetical protein
MQGLKAILTSSLLASLGTSSLAGAAFAATSHEARAHHAVHMSRGAADPEERPVARLECTINGTYLGLPYCFGSDQLGWTNAGGNRIRSAAY